MLLKDEDGKPYPEIWAVRNPHTGHLQVPAPRVGGVGSQTAASEIVAGRWGGEVVRCQLVPVDESKDEHGWCTDCPDREACMLGHSCEKVKEEAARAAAARTSEG